jgi:hypothetical protein
MSAVSISPTKFERKCSYFGTRCMKLFLFLASPGKRAAIGEEHLIQVCRFVNEFRFASQTQQQYPEEEISVKLASCTSKYRHSTVYAFIAPRFHS